LNPFFRQQCQQPNEEVKEREENEANSPNEQACPILFVQKNLISTNAEFPHEATWSQEIELVPIIVLPGKLGTRVEGKSKYL